MDIFTHALSGAVISTGLASGGRLTLSQRAGRVLTGLLGAVLPDIDAISMWSHFDGTFGRLFGLSHTGRVIYGSKFWYSHHAFFHSILASVLLGFLMVVAIFFIRRLRKKSHVSFATCFRKNLTLFCAFLLGYWSHLLGDLPTPASVWGGIDLFWPLPYYIGGWGKIWWWNNYDIFLILLSGLCLNVIILSLSGWKKIKPSVIVPVVIFLVFIGISVQVNTRRYNYAYTGNTTQYDTFEKQSKEEQERILGRKLYRSMVKFDQSIKINF